jgi:hypothetical protein
MQTGILMICIIVYMLQSFLRLFSKGECQDSRVTDRESWSQQTLAFQDTVASHDQDFRPDIPTNVSTSQRWAHGEELAPSREGGTLMIGAVEGRLA